MNIKEIIEEYLRKNGYEGLCCGGCWCQLDDLFPCDNEILDCVPVHKVKLNKMKNQKVVYGNMQVDVNK
jgi:hypothetical protein